MMEISPQFNGKSFMVLTIKFVCNYSPYPQKKEICQVSSTGLWRNEFLLDKALRYPIKYEMKTVTARYFDAHS